MYMYSILKEGKKCKFPFCLRKQVTVWEHFPNKKGIQNTYRKKDKWLTANVCSLFNINVQLFFILKLPINSKNYKTKNSELLTLRNAIIWEVVWYSGYKHAIYIQITFKISQICAWITYVSLLCSVSLFT